MYTILSYKYKYHIEVIKFDFLTQRSLLLKVKIIKNRNNNNIIIAIEHKWYSDCLKDISIFVYT